MRLGFDTMPIDHVERGASLDQPEKPADNGERRAGCGHHKESLTPSERMATGAGAAAMGGTNRIQMGTLPRHLFMSHSVPEENTKIRRFWRMVTAVSFVAAVGWGIAGCGGDSPAAPIPNFSATFVNRLYLPVTIRSGGSTLAILTGGSQSVVIPGGTLSVQWVADDAHYSDGSVVPDDLSGATILVADKATITITNVVGAATYFTPYIDNQTGGTITVGIAQAGTVSCVGTQSAAGGVSWGYYLLASTTEVRYYAGTKCSGAYRFWNTATLNGNIFGGTGLILLTADVVP